MDERPRPFLVGAILNAGLALLGTCVTLFVIGSGLMFSNHGVTLELALLGGGSTVFLVVLPVVGFFVSLKNRMKPLALATAALGLLALLGAAVLTGGVSLGTLSPSSTDPVPVEAPVVPP
ncbi:MAG: hypothetical protein JNM17_11995 [Archangium sp.]|nr:hypothetical protein [Archangium sp.]